MAGKIKIQGFVFSETTRKNVPASLLIRKVKILRLKGIPNHYVVIFKT